MLTDRVVSLRKANIFERHGYRHLISATLVSGPTDGAVQARSNYAVYRTRTNGVTELYNAGTYDDRIVSDGSQLRFAEKIVTYDTNRIDSLLVTPFRGGIDGRGGMPDSFDLKEHGLRVEIVSGLIFASFSSTVEPLRDYLGEMVVASIERIFNRDIVILGDQRQYMHGNWKLYAENTRDPYHASLLHLFHTTFGLYRSSQTGACLMDPAHRHTMLYAKSGTSSAEVDAEVYKDSRSFDSNYTLNDPSLLAGRPDFDDGITLVIMSIFPNLVVQQIANTLAVRQSVPTGVDSFELVWTQFGYADDDDEMNAIRIKQSNLIGPAGFISMEDGEAVEIVQKAILRDTDKSSYIAMGGGRAEDAEHLVTESAIIGFWEHYKKLLGIGGSAPS